MLTGTKRSRHGRGTVALGVSVVSALIAASTLVVAPSSAVVLRADELVLQDEVKPIPVSPAPRLARTKQVEAISRSFERTSERVLTVARSLKGSRYRLGGNTPAGFDCSGYVGYVLADVGITGLPRDSHSMFKSVPAVSRKEAKPGDLVFFHGKSGHVYHVGIFAGANDMWHAPRTGGTVGLHPIYSSNVTFGRVITSE